MRNSIIKELLKNNLEKSISSNFKIENNQSKKSFNANIAFGFYLYMFRILFESSAF